MEIFQEILLMLSLGLDFETCIHRDCSCVSKIRERARNCLTISSAKLGCAVRRTAQEGAELRGRLSHSVFPASTFPISCETFEKPLKTLKFLLGQGSYCCYFPSGNRDLWLFPNTFSGDATLVGAISLQNITTDGKILLT